MEDLLRNTTLTLIENQGATTADIPRLLTDKEYRSRFTRNLQNQEVADFWDMSITRFESTTSWNITGLP